MSSLFHVLLSLDAATLAWVVGLPHPRLLTGLMLAASAVGTSATVWLVLAAATLIRRPAVAGGAWQLGLALLLSLVVTDVALKPLVARSRPSGMAAVAVGEVSVPATYAFPSGHATSSFAAAFVLAHIWRRRRAWLWALAVLIAASRVYLGLHYPLDVIGGGLIGTAIAAFVLGGSTWYGVGWAPAPAER